MSSGTIWKICKGSFRAHQEFFNHLSQFIEYLDSLKRLSANLLCKKLGNLILKYQEKLGKSKMKGRHPGPKLRHFPAIIRPRRAQSALGGVGPLSGHEAYLLVAHKNMR